MKKALCILLFSFLLISVISAQKKLSQEQLTADADTLYAQMYDIHPNLFAIYPQSEFEKGLKEAKAQFRDSMTVVNFYRLITPLVVKLEDGHTFIRMPSQLLDKEKKIAFPLTVDINKKNYTTIIKDDYSGSGHIFPPQSRILSINGRDIKEILDRFLMYASGENNLFKFERVQEGFHLLPYLIYSDSAFTVTYQTGSKKKTISLAGISLSKYKEMETEKEKAQNKEHEQDYTLTVDNNHNTAIIDFRSFSNFDKFATFLDSTFTLIKEQNIKNLIVDVRKNGGGNSSLGDELFQYISPVPFEQFGKMDMKISPTLRRIFNDTIYTLGVSTFESSPKELRENNKRFTGNCYLLTSNYTFSSAADFSWAFHYFKMGKIIGEETGGLIVCYGDVAGSGLQNTGIRFGTSWKKFYGYGTDDSYNHGVKPDYEVPADKAMNKALELIKKQGR